MTVKIYLDVDDTLADFRGHCLTNGTPDYDKGFYNEPIETWTPDNHAVNAMQIKLMKREDFWMGIPVMEGALDLVATATTRAETYLLTALPRGDDHAMLEMVRRAKVEYCRHFLHFPTNRIIVCHRHEKANYATRVHTDQRNLLVDDAQRNIAEWTAAGGRGIVHGSIALSVSIIKGLFDR